MKISLYGAARDQPQPNPMAPRLLAFLTGESDALDAELVAAIRAEFASQDAFGGALEAAVIATAGRIAGRAAKLVGELEAPFVCEDSAAYRAGYSAGRYRGLTESASEVGECVDAAKREALGG